MYFLIIIIYQQCRLQPLVSFLLSAREHISHVLSNNFFFILNLIVCKVDNTATNLLHVGKIV